MAKVRKSNGETEDFEKSKIERSLKRAGADKDSITRIKKIISDSDYKSTDEIRRKITAELKNEGEKKIAEKFARTKRRKVIPSEKVDKGFVKLHQSTLETLDVEENSDVILSYGKKKITLKAQKSHSGKRVARLNPSDFKKVNLGEGKKVSIRKA